MTDIRQRPSDDTPTVGIIGGSGLYELFDDAVAVEVDTPWGAPSAPISVGTLGGRSVAFLPRHGPAHHLAPHAVPYRANLWALRALGVGQLFGVCASGSLQPHLPPGDFVVCDQLVDRTSGRADTYFDGDTVNHVSFADPFCPTLRAATLAASASCTTTVHDGGTVVVIQGPRFSTRAESVWFRNNGWDVVNMTQYPEAVLARELGLCYATIALVTDWDSGVEDDPSQPTVNQTDVLAMLKDNAHRVRDLLSATVAVVPDDSACTCEAGTNGILPSAPES